MKKMYIVSLFLLLMANMAVAVTSKDVLSDNQDEIEVKGVMVRKGTIAATIKNAAELDSLFIKKGSIAEIEKCLEDQRPLSKALWATELVDMLPLELWISDAVRPGRIAIAAMILQASPQLLDEMLKDKLQRLVENAHPQLRNEIEKALNPV